MASPSFKDIIKRIRSGQYAPIYYLYGDELWHIERIVDELDARVLTEQEKAFNRMVMYGKEASAKELLDFARRFPVMAERQLVIFKDARKMKSAEILEDYFAKPVASTIMVLVSDKNAFDKRTKIYKALSSTAVVFESKKPYDNQVPKWVSDYVEMSGSKIKPDAGQLLSEYLGTDLKKISNEIDKLLLQKDADGPISRDLVEQSIGISREYNVFELQKALSLESADRIIWIADRMAENMRNHPLVMTMGSLYRYFSNVYALHGMKSRGPDAARKLGINPYFMKEYQAAAQRYNQERLRYIFRLLSEYDLKSKGVGASGSVSQEDLFKEMIGRMLIRQPQLQ